MGIKNKKEKIRNDYNIGSIKNINKIKIYPNVIKTIKKAPSIATQGFLC